MEAGLLGVRTKVKESWAPDGVIPAIDCLYLGFMLYESILLKSLLFGMFVS